MMVRRIVAIIGLVEGLSLSFAAVIVQGLHNGRLVCIEADCRMQKRIYVRREETRPRVAAFVPAKSALYQRK